MKISYNWLKEYIETEESPETIAVWLTDSGLEVEKLEKHQTIKGGLEGVIIGEVLSCEKHPNADKLTLTTVDIGKEEKLSIVCGAPNVKEGQKVPVVTVGATLYTEKGDLKIKEAKIRGQLSQGMICAEDELGIGTSHDGIMVLDPDVPVGTPAKEYFGIEEDWVFEIGLTPNRIDGASHMGAARDIAAVINCLNKNQKKKLKNPEVDKFKVDNESLHIPVEIHDEKACIRYSGLTISDIKVEESPNWLKNRLKAIGLKPLNNIVDITNFVLHETGQPLHAFDTSKIKGNKIIVRKAEKNTSFLTLEEQEIKLTADDLMICNADEPMCLAGILGGINSGINYETKSLFLESACFEASTIRKSSKYHQLNTDASFRFERGSDPNMTIYALKRAAMLIKNIAGGKISSKIVDVYPKPVQNKEIKFYYSELQRLVGQNIEKSIVKNILNSLEIEILKEEADHLLLSVPPFRVDVDRQADVVEEILRIYGYNNIEIPEKSRTSVVLNPKPDKEHLQNQVSDMLSGQGFREIMNNSLTNIEYYKNNKYYLENNTVTILNPTSKDLNAMRQTLLYGFLETVSRNINYKNNDLKLYEFGNTYKLINRESGDSLDKYDEIINLGILTTGKRFNENWKFDDVDSDFFDMKNRVINIIKKMGGNLFNIEEVENDRHPDFAYAVDYNYYNRTMVTVGKISDDLLKKFDVEQDVFFASIDWQEMVDLHARHLMEFEELTKYPDVRRDLALLIDKNVSYKQIEELAFKIESKYLVEINLFDVYQDDEKTGKDKKSYAISFILRDKTKTMTDKQIDKIMNNLADAFKKYLGASIR